MASGQISKYTTVLSFVIDAVITCVLVGDAFPAAKESLESLTVEGALQRARREELDTGTPQIPQL